ncbi:putative transcription factor C2H2 family [Helianthus debilis subsp. tardiflorus]
MVTFRPVFTKLISVLFLLLHLGCFTIIPTDHHHRRRRKKPSSPLPLLRPTTTKILKPNKTWYSFIKRIFSFKPTSQPDPNSIIHYVPASPASSTRSLRNTNPTRPGSLTDSDFFPLRNDIYPCTNCGEVFQKPGFLEQHLAFKHAVSELSDDDPGKNIVRIIFETGWPGPGSGKNPMVYRVLKIHNCPKILTRFEEYREVVKSKAARYGGVRRRDERCIADGNELLRFYCATFLCDLGQNGNSSICSHQYCSVCGIIRVGFSSKMDGISTYSTSWKGHVALPEDIEEEFRFMHVKRAMLVCRVIAGRVGCDPEMGDKDDPGYDSLVGRGPGVGETRLEEEDEIIVFNPRAVLPCFVIAYTV